MTTNHPLNLMAEHLAARSKDIADRDIIIEELLEALIACNDAMEYMSEYDIPITLPQQVRDAIAKATT